MLSKALVYVSSEDIVECIHEASIENILTKLLQSANLGSKCIVKPQDQINVICLYQVQKIKLVHTLSVSSFF